MNPIEVRIPLEILMIVITAVVSLLFGIILHNIKKMSRRNEERYLERVEREYLMNKYFFSVGSLTIDITEILAEKGFSTEALNKTVADVIANKRIYYDRIEKWRVEHDMK